jgi:predicted DNA-binding transcriptional regulator YafY
VFTEEQALGLVMAVLDGQPGAIDAEDLIGAALSKVIRALPESIGRQAAALRAYASAAPDRNPARPDPATVSTLIAAVADRECVSVTYRAESGDEWDSEVDPWAVVVRYGRWYLLCRSHRADAIRTYRVDRIHGVRKMARAFAPPEDLDPVAALEANLGAGWKYATRVVFDAPQAKVAPWIRPPMGRLEPDGDNRCVLTGSTGNPSMYAQEWLAAVPFDFVVEGGPELLAAADRVAERFRKATAR